MTDIDARIEELYQALLLANNRKRAVAAPKAQKAPQSRLKTQEVAAEAPEATGAPVYSAGASTASQFPTGFPQPLSVKLVPDDKQVASLPDRLPATLANPDLEKNPAIEPFNWDGNPEYAKDYTFSQVRGQPRVKAMFETSLVKPRRLTGMYDSGSGGLGAILYGVAGTGKTSIATAAINLLCGDEGCQKWPHDGVYRSQEEARRLDESDKLKGWVKRYFWKEDSPGSKTGHYEMPKIIAIAAPGTSIVKPLVGEGERTMARYFEMARAVAPTIIFFDEADSFMDESSKNNAGIISAFKVQLTAADKLKEKPVVYSIIATNNPLLIPEPVLSRFGGSVVEVGLPDKEARRGILEQAITKQLRASNWKTSKDKRGPIYWIADATKTLDELANMTRPPKDKAEYERRELKLWSARDLVSMVRIVVGNVKEDVESSSNLYHCKGDEGSCGNYEDKDIYIMDVDGSLGGREKAVDVIARGEGGKIRARPVTLKDFQSAWPNIRSTVDLEAIKQQMRFNAQLGTQVNENSPAQRMLDELFNSRIGANTTVPDN